MKSSRRLIQGSFPLYFFCRSKFPARTSQSPDKSPRGQEQKRESPKQVPTRESPVKRDRMSPSSAPVSLQQDRKPQDSRREETPVVPTQRENGLMSTGRSQSSSYEPPTGWKHCHSILAWSVFIIVISCWILSFCDPIRQILGESQIW